MLHEAQADSKDESIALDDDLRSNIQLGGYVDLLHLAARAHAWDQKCAHAAVPLGALVDECLFAAPLHPAFRLVGEPRPRLPAPGLRLHKAGGERAGPRPASGQPLLVLRGHQVRNILPLHHLQQVHREL